MQQPTYPITIFYDGACPMCVRLMEAFKNKDAKHRLLFVNIADPHFDAKHFGLEGAPLQSYIHATDSNGRVVRGVDVFLWLWQATDRPLLAFLVGFSFIKSFGKVIYSCISRVRYRLWKKKGMMCDEHCKKGW